MEMEELFSKLLEALQEKRDFEYNKNGLKISSKSKNGTTSITMEYDSIVEDEIEEFEDYLNSLEDEVFIGTCEFLGNEDVQKIQECLDSKDLESVRAATIKFKKAVSDYAKEQIKFWERYA